MLEALKKAFGTEPKKETLEQIAPVQEGLTDLTQLDINEQLNAALNEIVAKDVSLADLSSQLVSMTQQIEDYKQQLESLQGYAAEAEAKAAAIAAEAQAKDIADKKQKLADVIGAENAGFNTTWEAVAGLDAEAFNIVVAGFAAAFAKEADSAMFNEVGVSGVAEPIEDGESATMKILKKTYNAN